MTQLVVPPLGWGAPNQRLLRDAGMPLGQRDRYPLDVQDITGLTQPGAGGPLHPSQDIRNYVYYRWEFPFDDPAGSGFVENLAGLGSDVAQVTGEDNGVADFQSGTALNGYALWRWANSQTHVRLNRNPYTEFRAAPVTSGLTSKRHVGLSSDWLTADPAEFCGLRCVGTAGGVNNWEALTVTGGTPTATDSGIAGTLNTWRTLVCYGLDKGRRVRFEIWDDNAPPKLLGIIEHTTNIPTGQLTLGIRVWNDNAGTNRVWRADYIEHYYSRRALP